MSVQQAYLDFNRYEVNSISLNEEFFKLKFFKH